MLDSQPEQPPEQPAETAEPLSDFRFLLKAAWLPALSLLGFFLCLMLGNTLFIFWELLESAQAPWVHRLKLCLSNLPAIGVVCGPVLLLWPAVFMLKKWETQGGVPFPVRRLLPLTLTLGLFLSALLLFVQEYIVPEANQIAVNQLKELMMEGRKDDMIFKPQQDIRQMSAREAWMHLNHTSQAGVSSPRDWLDFYTKFSLSFAALAFAFWGLLTARLLQRNWRFFWFKLISFGTFLPVLGWYFVYSWAHALGSDGRMAPFLAAVIPVLAVGGIGLLGFVFLPPNSRDLSKT